MSETESRNEDVEKGN